MRIGPDVVASQQALGESVNQVAIFAMNRHRKSRGRDALYRIVELRRSRNARVGELVFAAWRRRVEEDLEAHDASRSQLLDCVPVGYGAD